MALEYEIPVKLAAECELWVGWPLISALAGELFTVSRNWLTWKGQSLQGQQVPQMAKHQNTENEMSIIRGRIRIQGD